MTELKPLVHPAVSPRGNEHTGLGSAPGFGQNKKQGRHERNNKMTTTAPEGWTYKRVWARGILVELMGWLHAGWAGIIAMTIASKADLSVDAGFIVWGVLGLSGALLMLAGVILWWMADQGEPTGPLFCRFAMFLGVCAKWSSLLALSPIGFFGGKMSEKYGRWGLWNSQIKK